MAKTISDPKTVKENVREYYASRIQGTASSCCGSSSGCGGSTASSCCEPSTEIALYGADTIASLPSDVTPTSFGCGNPIAIATLQPGEVVLDLGSGGGLD